MLGNLRWAEDVLRKRPIWQVPNPKLHIICVNFINFLFLMCNINCTLHCTINFWIIRKHNQHHSHITIWLWLTTSLPRKKPIEMTPLTKVRKILRALFSSEHLFVKITFFSKPVKTEENQFYGFGHRRIGNKKILN